MLLNDGKFRFILWACLLALFLQPYITAGVRVKRKGEFLAGTFILTQKSLSEAPYRYAGVLRKALDRAEMKDPPSKSDEENCDVRYRIRPSGTTNNKLIDILKLRRIKFISG